MNTIADNFEEALILALENWSFSSVLQSEARRHLERIGNFVNKKSSLLPESFFS